MKKILLLFALVSSFTVLAQAPQVITKPLYLKTVPAATINDTMVLVQGNDMIVKKIPLGSISGGGGSIPSLQEVTNNGNITTNAITINSAYLYNDNSPNNEKVLFGKGTNTITATSITAMGNNAGVGATGGQNVYFGNSAGQGVTSAYNSTYIGYSAGVGNTGNAGTFLGAATGTNNTGSSCTLLGRGFYGNTYNNIIGLGDGNHTATAATANNQIVFGIDGKNIRFDGAVSADKLYSFPAANTGTFAVVGTTAPASATAAGDVGEIRITSTYIYTCIAANTWVRAALATW